MNQMAIVSLRMERQFLSRRANQEEYRELYRDMQPGQNVYWNGFGDPPSLTFRADFNDIEFNRARQAKRELVKGRFAGGNLGWIVPEDLELFAALYRKPLTSPNETQLRILGLIEREGPLNIQRIKEETGLLVKAITPALHRLQEAFLVYEDQYDGEWDRGWYLFPEMFPAVDPEKYTRRDALRIVLLRFARRQVLFDPVQILLPSAGKGNPGRRRGACHRGSADGNGVGFPAPVRRRAAEEVCFQTAALRIRHPPQRLSL